MSFWSLLVVAWLPVLQVLLIGLLGALLASGRLDVLTADALKSINKVVYIVFVPSLVFSTLSSTVTLKDIVSWLGLGPGHYNWAGAPENDLQYIACIIAFHMTRPPTKKLNTKDRRQQQQ